MIQLDMWGLELRATSWLRDGVLVILKGIREDWWQPWLGATLLFGMVPFAGEGGWGLALHHARLGVRTAGRQSLHFLGEWWRCNARSGGRMRWQGRTSEPQMVLNLVFKAMGLAANMGPWPGKQATKRHADQIFHVYMLHSQGTYLLYYCTYIKYFCASIHLFVYPFVFPSIHPAIYPSANRYRMYQFEVLMQAIFARVLCNVQVGDRAFQAQKSLLVAS